MNCAVADDMKRHLCLVMIAGLLAGPAMSAEAGSSAPPLEPPAELTKPLDAPPFEPPLEQSFIECDLRASPDYVPGIDAKGRAVVPADIPTGLEIEINTEVFVETRSRSRQLRGTGVIVNLPGLGAPACVPVDETPRE